MIAKYKTKMENTIACSPQMHHTPLCHQLPLYLTTAILFARPNRLQKAR